MNVFVTNNTRHKLEARADAVPDSSPLRVDVTISTPPDIIDPLVKELTETKAVLGDLMQERLTGRKIYVIDRLDKPLSTVFLSPKAACDHVEAMGRSKYDWQEEVSDGQRCWYSGAYTVTEHEIG